MNSKYRKSIFLLTLIVFFILSAFSQEAVREVNPEAVFAMDDYEKDLTIHFFHLIPPDTTEKSGESIFIKTPKGKTILIDAGKPVVGPLINDYLTKLNVDTIDIVMPSHPHSDHIGGYLTLFNEKEIGKVIEINLPLEDSSIYQQYNSLIKEKGFNVEYAEAGDVIEIEQDLYMEILNPPKGLSPETYSFGTLTAGIVNDVSMVVKLTHKENTFLFTGDIYKGVESQLVSKYGGKLDVDVIVAPHHGIGTSSSKKLIETANPEITLFPTNILFDVSIIEKYKDQGSEVYVSKLDGNVLLVSDGKKIDVYTETESDEMNDDVVEDVNS